MILVRLDYVQYGLLRLYFNWGAVVNSFPNNVHFFIGDGNAFYELNVEKLKVTS